MKQFVLSYVLPGLLIAAFALAIGYWVRWSILDTERIMRMGRVVGCSEYGERASLMRDYCK